MMKTIQTECSDCYGTGVYCGFMEPKGTGVVCLGCGGSGAKLLKYKPFEGRKQKRGVTTVVVRATRSILEANNPKTAMPYEEFLGKVAAAEPLKARPGVRETRGVVREFLRGRGLDVKSVGSMRVVYQDSDGEGCITEVR